MDRSASNFQDSCTSLFQNSSLPETNYLMLGGRGNRHNHCSNTVICCHCSGDPHHVTETMIQRKIITVSSPSCSSVIYPPSLEGCFSMRISGQACCKNWCLSREIPSACGFYLWAFKQCIKLLSTWQSFSILDICVSKKFLRLLWKPKMKDIFDVKSKNGRKCLYF